MSVALQPWATSTRTWPVGPQELWAGQASPTAWNSSALLWSGTSRLWSTIYEVITIQGFADLSVIVDISQYTSLTFTVNAGDGTLAYVDITVSPIFSVTTGEQIGVLIEVTVSIADGVIPDFDSVIVFSAEVQIYFDSSLLESNAALLEVYVSIAVDVGLEEYVSVDFDLVLSVTFSVVSGKTVTVVAEFSATLLIDTAASEVIVESMGVEIYANFSSSIDFLHEVLASFYISVADSAMAGEVIEGAAEMSALSVAEVRLLESSWAFDASRWMRQERAQLDYAMGCGIGGSWDVQNQVEDYVHWR